MRNFKRILLPVVLILTIAAVNLGLNYALIPYSYVRIMMHQIQTEEYDTVFLGTSHGLNGISPKVITEKTGKNAVNLSLGGEYPRDAYYLLKQVCEKKKPERVVYELDPGYWCTPEGQRGDFNRIFYEMPASLTKVEYFFAKERELDFRAALFPWFYYRGQFRDMKEIIQVKQGEDYKNYGTAAFWDGGQEFADGFLRNTPVPGMKEEKDLVLWKEADRNEDSFRYFEKLASFCKKRNIELIVVTTPVPAETLEKYAKEFQEADAFFQEYLERLGLEYWNYNCTERKIADFDYSLNAFTDYEGHMNVQQAEAFSAQLAEDLW
ncbi:hypothetical protein E5329_09320 [Petralouisia muris]|jgi:hypothetical protein|uniref:Uncharacterized protein n=1 Tax=Petralouisia muris TaxID=3032872 RepID=A0AC61RXC4_9FIRM|nr:hypothetical protein [Petralouisia muris]TGY96566.1 hypothetical protein E5329_09320 [Petralouisia muris]